MYNIKKGIPVLGCVLDEAGANLGIFSDVSRSMILEIYHSCKESIPVFKVTLDRNDYTTGDIFHIYVEDIKAGMNYIWRAVDNEGEISKGLIDPYACALSEMLDEPFGYKSIVTSRRHFETKRPCTPWEKTIIYELHTGSFTKHASSKMQENERGTYQGIISRIPYLKELGITAVELLPIYKWNSHTIKNKNPFTGEQLQDVWGYNPIAFFALDEKYCIQKEGLEEIEEFKKFVDIMHQNDLEVILDVVYNHTGEGGCAGKTFNFKQLSNKTYYKLDENNEYMNFSGTGNTLNTNHYVVKQMILDSLRYWVTCMGVDGFRFDLASILGQNKSGKWINHSVLRDISEDPILSHVKLISESWDASGSYDVGRMPYPFREWSDYFRDTIRKFVKGDQGLTKSLADCLLGKEIYFANSKKNSLHAIHFITAHDGFTLWDLVSYNEKHNEANGEGNRDGHNANYTYNCGIEGETDDVNINNMRKRRVKNFMCLLFLSKGIPMLLMGDEFCRTQQGNNNAYCQDNDIVWVDWERTEKFEDILTFVKTLIKIRRSLMYFNDKQSDAYYITWHGVGCNKPDWSYYSRSLAWQIRGKDENIYMIANSYHEPLSFELPPTKTGWARMIDTNLSSPKDATIIGETVKGKYYQAESFSICLFVEIK